MSDLAISVRGLVKEYRIAHNQERHLRVTDAAWSALKALVRRPTYETFRALDDVSFDVRKGDVVGIIGRNGAGKSTLLKVLSRITEPTEGEIRLYGRVGSLLEVGTGFHPELTGRENIYLNGAILGMRKKEIDRQFDAIVDFAEVEKFLDTPVKRYSSGMYVRLAFAVAAHLNPEILIVDEVLAVGDAQFQQKCLGKMQDVSRQEGRTVLFVSHNMAAVADLCRHGLYLRQGRLTLDGPVERAIAAYRSDASRPCSDPSLGLAIQGLDLQALVEHQRVAYVGRLSIHAHRSFQNLAAQVAICTAGGMRVILLNSALQGITYDISPGRWLIPFTCYGIELVPGQYDAEVKLLHDYSSSGSDLVASALIPNALIAQSRKFNDLSYPQPPWCGLAICDQEWQNARRAE